MNTWRDLCVDYPEHAHRVDQDLLGEEAPVEIAKLVVLHEEDDDVGFLECILQADEMHPRLAGDRGRCRLHMRIDDVDLAGGGVQKLLGDVEGRALAQIVDVRLVGQAEAARSPGRGSAPAARRMRSTTCCGLASLTSRAVRIRRACSGARGR